MSEQKLYSMSLLYYVETSTGEKLVAFDVYKVFLNKDSVKIGTYISSSIEEANHMKEIVIHAMLNDIDVEPTIKY